MTVRELYRRLRDRLEPIGDSAAFEAGCLLERTTGVGRGEMPLRGGDAVPEEQAAAALEATERRAAGEPLQYLLGEWDFLSLTLSVGKGVLIPRPDTELLCETAARWLSADRSSGRTENTAAVRILDLCAGSGCVGLGIASLLPGAAVTAVEWSDEAMDYLRVNCARYPAFRVTPVKADALRDAARFEGGFDALVSNPPYIPSGDLAGLMPEVRREPRLALDGGEDGLRFYRVIAEQWTAKLRPGGLCAVEVGIGQAAAVAELFDRAGLRSVDCRRDIAGIDRVVTGVRA